MWEITKEVHLSFLSGETVLTYILFSFVAIISEFCDAAFRGDKEKLSQLINQSTINLDQTDTHGNCSLHLIYLIPLSFSSLFLLFDFFSFSFSFFQAALLFLIPFSMATERQPSCCLLTGQAETFSKNLSRSTLLLSILPPAVQGRNLNLPHRKWRTWWKRY